MSYQTGDQLLAMVQEKYPNYHPLIAIVDIAHDPEASLHHKMEAAKTVLKYTIPEVKSIDISGRISHNINTLDLLIHGIDDPIDGELVAEELESEGIRLD